MQIPDVGPRLTENLVCLNWPTRSRGSRTSNHNKLKLYLKFAIDLITYHIIVSEMANRNSMLKFMQFFGTLDLPSCMDRRYVIALYFNGHKHSEGPKRKNVWPWRSPRDWRYVKMIK